MAEDNKRRKRDEIKKYLRLPLRSSKTNDATSQRSLDPGVLSTASSTSGSSRVSAPQQSQDVLAEGLWKTALEKLPVEQKAAIVQQRLLSKLDTLQQLRVAAEQKRDECDSKSWKFEFWGRQIILRDVAQKVVTWIDKFKEIGDIAVNFDPVHAALPWAGVRFLLQIAVTDRQQMGALLTRVEKVSWLINRCQIYERLYLRDTKAKTNQERQALENLESALGALYSAILETLAKAIGDYDKTARQRILSGVFDPNEIAGIIDRLNELENRVEKEASNCKSTLDQKTFEELERLLEDLEKPIFRIDSRVEKLQDILERSEQSNILTWVSQIPYEENHNTARAGWTKGTGQWLLAHKRYREWRASSASTILWLHGFPGAGKTKLISTVVEDLREALKSSPNDERLAYFYCDRNQSDRQDPSLILSSFVRQLSVSQSGRSIQHSIVQFYTEKQRTGFASGALTMEESQQNLLRITRLYPQITLVVDALDESDKQTRNLLMDVLDTLVSDSKNLVKIFISSRPDLDIKDRFQSGPNMEIQATDNLADISKFVDDELEKRPRYWKDRVLPSLRQEIRKTLVEKCQGMFQWVTLQLRQLFKLSWEHEIRERLGKLPKDLDQAYKEIYDRIKDREGSATIIADRAFQWVMCSREPLNPATLLYLVCQDPNTDSVRSVDIDMDFLLLEACQHLLVVDSALKVCRFSHLSVQEYFETRHWSTDQANGLAAKVCLLLLDDPGQQARQMRLVKKHEQEHEQEHDQDEESETGSLESVEEDETEEDEAKGVRETAEDDAAEYATLHWASHVSAHEERIDKDLTIKLTHFLGSMNESGLAYRNWYRSAHELRRYSSFDSKILKLDPCSLTSLAICSFGFYHVLQEWWEVGPADVNQRNSEDHSLLQLAAAQGSISVTRRLLELGADANAQGGDNGTALQAASLNGHERVVRILLEKGADVHAVAGSYGTALQAASWNGSEMVVKTLLEKGADVHAVAGSYGTALQAASWRGSEMVVKTLLEKGADVHAVAGCYGTALQAASLRGSEMVVRILLEKGADVNTVAGDYGTALQAASLGGNEMVVRILLEKGADANAVAGHYGTALQIASLGGNKMVVRILLEKGADVNAVASYYGTALQAASWGGNKMVVKILLEKGADVNAVAGRYGTALQAASLRGYEMLVKILLEKGADVNAVAGDYGTALQAASWGGNKMVVKILLEKGADANTVAGDYGTALQAASSNGHEKIVALLIKRGADTDTCTLAMFEAADRGDTNAVKVLLKHGVDVNAKVEKWGSKSALEVAAERFRDSEETVKVFIEAGTRTDKSTYNKALLLASEKGRPKTVKLLLDNGADVNAKSTDYGSALEAAASGHHDDNEQVVKILIEAGADEGTYGSALVQASRNQHIETVKLLLDKGADVNTSSGEYGSALEAAAGGYLDNEEVVKILIEAGADEDVYDFALRQASECLNVDIVELLLEVGADANVESDEHGSALLVAITGLFVFTSDYPAKEADQRTSRIVEALLDAGADVNAKCGKYGTALQAASYVGKKGAVKILLRKGATDESCYYALKDLLEMREREGDTEEIEVDKLGEAGVALDREDKECIKAGRKAVIDLLEAHLQEAMISESTCLRAGLIVQETQQQRLPAETVTPNEAAGAVAREDSLMAFDNVHISSGK